MGIRQLLIQLEIPSSAVRVQQNSYKILSYFFLFLSLCKHALADTLGRPNDYSEILSSWNVKPRTCWNLWPICEKWKAFLFTEAFQNDIFWFKWLNSSLCMPSLGLFTHQEQSKANPVWLQALVWCLFCNSLQVKKWLFHWAEPFIQLCCSLWAFLHWFHHSGQTDVQSNCEQGMNVWHAEIDVL